MLVKDFILYATFYRLRMSVTTAVLKYYDVNSTSNRNINEENRTVCSSLLRQLYTSWYTRLKLVKQPGAAERKNSGGVKGPEGETRIRVLLGGANHRKRSNRFLNT